MSRRLLTDKLFEKLMTVGGLSVIVAVSAIFVYLVSVVVPLFMLPGIDHRAQFATPGGTSQATLTLTGEEQREIGSRVGAGGAITFFKFASGETIGQVQVPVPEGVRITSAETGERRSFSQAFGLSDGRVLLVKQSFSVSFPNNKRVITPALAYPVGEAPLALDPQGRAIQLIGMQQSDDGSTIAAVTEDGRLLLSAVNISNNAMTGETKSEVQSSEIANPPAGIRQLVVEAKQRELYVLHGDAKLARYNISDKSNPKLLETVELAKGQKVTALTMLSGGYSLIVGAAYVLTHLLSGRAAYIHVGAMIGTIMVANVLMLIIPGQRKMVEAMAAGKLPDPKHGLKAKQRSVHNNYFTLPVLFIMISNHYAMTYRNDHAWLVLALIMAAGVFIRHFFNLRHKGRVEWRYPALGVALLVAVAVAIAPKAPVALAAAPAMDPAAQFKSVHAIIAQRCATCHSAQPTQPGFATAPAGMMLDNETEIRQHAAQIYKQAIELKAMPIGNLTNMTEAERSELGAWLQQTMQGAK